MTSRVFPIMNIYRCYTAWRCGGANNKHVALSTKLHTVAKRINRKGHRSLYALYLTWFPTYHQVQCKGESVGRKKITYEKFRD